MAPGMCAEVQPRITWLLDDELDADEAQQLQTHIGACAGCRALWERESRVRLLLREVAQAQTAPARLRRRVRAAIASDASAVPRAGGRAWPVALAAGVLLSFMWQGAGGSAAASDLEEIAQRHVGDLPMDIVGADMAVVQNYFNNKLRMAVSIPRLAPAVAAQRFGGRIMQWHDRDAAYVRYDTDKGRVSVFVYPDQRVGSHFEAPRFYPAGESQMVVRRVRGGFTAARWRADGLVYSLVTQLPEAELRHALHAQQVAASGALATAPSQLQD